MAADTTRAAFKYKFIISSNLKSYLETFLLFQNCPETDCEQQFPELS